MTPEVLKARRELSEAYLFNDYYFERFEEIVNKYPVEWVQSSALYSNLRTHYQVSKFNIDTLFGPDSDSGALGCFNNPEKCPSLAETILSKIKQVDESSVLTAI